MKRLIILLLIVGCGTVQLKQSFDSKYLVKQPQLGFTVSRLDSIHLKITEVNEIAQRNGMKTGDIIKSINYQPIFQPIDIYKAVRGHNKGDIIPFELVRNGSLMNINYIIEEVKWRSKIQRRLKDEIDIGNEVRLIIMAGDINNSLLDNSKQLEQWTKSVIIQQTTSRESSIASWLELENFKLIDRSTTNKIIKEMKFSSSGLIDQSKSVEIGKMVGATHIWVFSLGRFTSQGHSYVDSFSEKLIEIETGTILTTEIRREYE